MVTSLATPQAALDALDTDLHSMVYVEYAPGQMQSIDAISWDTRFGVRDTSTATITIPLPRPTVIQPNAAIRIEAGHNDLIGTMFSGRIPAWRSATTDRADLLTVRPVGWSSLLAYRDRYDLSWDGPITIRALFDALCARRGVPSYRADAVLSPDGTTEIALGGNLRIDEGKVKLAASTTPLAFLRSCAEPFGYRIYDTQDGTVRLSRLSGRPGNAPVVRFVEQQHILSADAEYDISGYANYHDVSGPTYEDEFGASIPIRAFPAQVSPSPLVPVNEGIAYEPYRNSLLVTQELAEIVRQVREIDGSAPHQPVSWSSVAVPGVSVGDTVAIDAPVIEAQQSYWVDGLRVQLPESGALTATWDGWVGGGESLPAGDNRTITMIQDAPRHYGDESLWHYAVPSPLPGPGVWPVTIPDRATAINVRGWHHGTNSQLLGGVQTDLEVTKWEVHLVGADRKAKNYRPAASGNMPVSPENLSERIDPVTKEGRYKRFVVVAGVVTDPGYWAQFAVNLNRLDPADYSFELVPGIKGGKDDFEVRRVAVEVFGIAEPIVVPDGGQPS